jgi:hypothetical protein
MDDSAIQPQESSHDLKGGDRFGKEMSDYLGGITRKTIGAMLAKAPWLEDGFDSVRRPLKVKFC